MAIDCFLKIKGIPGGSRDKLNKDEIELDSLSWGATQTGTFSSYSGGGAGRCSMQDFSFTMKVNKASPKLLLACATGEHIDEAVLTIRKAGKDPQPFRVVIFRNLLISSYQTSIAGEDVVDHISINFREIEDTYKQQNDDGTLGGAVTAKYKLNENWGQ